VKIEPELKFLDLLKKVFTVQKVVLLIPRSTVLLAPMPDFYTRRHRTKRGKHVDDSDSVGRP
jgi:hypothetical protein